MLETILCWLHKYESLAIWLEGIALVAIFVLDWRNRKDQRRDQEEQHRETSAQLKVSQVQADALMNIERAWILPKELVGERRNFHRDGIDIIVTLKNYGKTPAWVIERSFRCMRLSDEALKSGLEFAGPIVSECGEPIAPDGQFPDIRCPLELTEDLLGRPGLGTVIIYGYVKYRDVFYETTGKARETFMRMRFERTQHDIILDRDGQWVYDGPPEANRHT
jgi:hypothetical protein